METIPPRSLLEEWRRRASKITAELDSNDRNDRIIAASDLAWSIPKPIALEHLDSFLARCDDYNGHQTSCFLFNGALRPNGLKPRSRGALLKYGCRRALYDWNCSAPAIQPFLWFPGARSMKYKSFFPVHTIDNVLTALYKYYWKSNQFLTCGDEPVGNSHTLIGQVLEGEPIYFVEDFENGCEIYKAENHPAIICYTQQNLKEVVSLYQERYTNKVEVVR